MDNLIIIQWYYYDIIEWKNKQKTMEKNRVISLVASIN